MAAKLQLAKSKPIIIGIGGGAGKTSVCKLLSIILREKYKVKASGGLNTETGVPLSILNLPPNDYSFFDWTRIGLLIPIKLMTQWKKYDFCIAEMAIEKPNDMDYLLKIIKPKIAALTNITLEHSENFDPFVRDKKEQEKEVLKLIEKEEGKLIQNLPPDGVAILNIDDEKIAKLKTKSKKITVSIKNETADIFVKKIKISQKETNLEIVSNEKIYKSKLRPLSNAYIHTILITLGLAKACGIKISEAIEIIEKKFTLPPGRLSIFEGTKGTTIIDSSYNAQPIAVLDALEFLATLGKNKRKVAILGDMRELGKESEKSHLKVAQKLKEVADFSIIIGPLMKKYIAPTLKKEKLPHKTFKNFTQSKEFIKKEIKTGDIILVKGSQNTLLLERVVEMLLENKKEKRKLCRQRPFWEKRREEIP